MIVIQTNFYFTFKANVYGNFDFLGSSYGPNPFNLLQQLRVQFHHKQQKHVEVRDESRNSLSIDMFLVFGMIGVLFLVLVSFVIYFRTKSKLIIC